MNANWSGGLITKQGNYTLASSKQTVAVWVDKEHLVRYSITDAAGKTLFITSERASAYDKWLLFFDAKGWLWFESSDVGCSVAKKREDGSYQELPIVDEADLIREMPDEFFKRLPESTQKKWSVHRKQGG